MRKEQVALATRASPNYLNGASRNASSEQLATVGFNQVKVQAGANGRVAGCALRKKQHGVLRPHRIGVVDLAKKVGKVGELRLEA